MEYRNYAEAQGRQMRTFTTELRAVGGGGIGAGDEFALVGYAAKFDSWSKDLGQFKEKIQPGAFSRSIKQNADVKALFNHAPDNVLGRTKSGTLVLNEDANGLCFRCQLNPRSQYHRDLYESVKRGDISECSFAFTVPVGGDLWTTGTDADTGKEIGLRTLVNVDLLDVSIVTYPAYDDTSVASRSEKFGYGRKSSVLDSPSDLKFKEDMLRKAARAMGKSLLAFAERECPNCAGGGDDRPRMIRGHMEVCAQMLECAASTAETVENIFNGWDDEEDDSLRARTSATYQSRRKKFREMHREFHRMLGECCGNHARMRLSAGEILD
jgi:Escherichia/Staphylococcus phage prohead protease